MSTLITGSEGFLGLHLARLLHAKGARVVGLDVTASAALCPDLFTALGTINSFFH
jgi:nucleoside-diphosphate-sugar epimerase